MDWALNLMTSVLLRDRRGDRPGEGGDIEMESEVGGMHLPAKEH